eukprot:TRINITY_DN4827_c0_g1_i2.p1 TRINITY_DN4827_c0_g1~~TRINITY_DN4827_c0_g1_i2.p1  ORF type:complete len:927 (-),score=193.67 TRINITY_DN4827_c0_g1_i2:1921-4701(-)
MMVFLSTAALMPSGRANSTGWLNPRVSLRVEPAASARQPTPLISSTLEQPWLTPVTIFWMRLRNSPQRPRALSDSSTGATTMPPSSWLTCTMGCSSRLRVPLGPFTSIFVSSKAICTPSGTTTGCFPTRLMIKAPRPLPNRAEDFAAHLGLAGRLVAQHALGGGEDVHPQAAAHLGYLIKAHIHPAAGLGHPLDALDHRLAGHIAQLDGQQALLVVGLHREVGHIALLLEHPGHRGLEPGGRDDHLVMASHERVAHAGEQVGYGILHRHDALLPARLDHAGDLAPQRHVAEADAADAELAYECPRPSADGAAVVGAHPKLGLRLGLVSQRRPGQLFSPPAFQALKGMPSNFSRARPSSSVGAVVTMVMFIPLTLSILSYSISGKMMCSLMPKVQFPRPSKALGLTPRKSRTRGRATCISLSKNSHMRSLRSVTEVPTGMPSRSLNEAMERLARLIMARWPAIRVSSSAAWSRSLMFWMASPTPMLSTALVRRGTCMMLVQPKPSMSWGTTSPSQKPRSLGTWFSLIFLQAPLLKPALVVRLVPGNWPGAFAAPGSAIHIFAALVAEAGVFAILQRLAGHPPRLVALGAEHHQVADGQGRFALHDAALAGLAGPGVALDHVDLFHQGALFVRDDPEHLAYFALFAAGGHQDLVVLFYVQLALHGFTYRTSGARETIFMKFLARSSRATGPKMRVPMGSRAWLISTAELSSNLMKVPSGRGTSLAVRTTTAFITSPFFTLLLGRASLTDTTMMSPTEAQRRLEPPNTFMQYSLLAPLLSAARRLVSGWIMASRSYRRPLGHPLQHFADAPALVTAQGAALADEHRVAHAAVVGLVVGHELGPPAHVLLVDGMLDQAFHQDHHRLVHLVADHQPGQSLGVSPFLVGHGILLPKPLRPGADSSRSAPGRCLFWSGQSAWDSPVGRWHAGS